MNEIYSKSKFCCQNELFSLNMTFSVEFQEYPPMHNACFQQKHNQTYGVLAGGEWALVSVPLKDAGTSHSTVRQCWLV